MANLTTAEFFGTPVRIIDHASRRWLTAEEAGLALGYNPANAGAGIRNLYNRHLDEFTEADTCRINLMRQGQMREFLIFSASGCHLLGFFANTPRAKAFRAWAKQVLESPALPAPVVLPARSLKSSRANERRVFELFVAGHTPTEICRLLGVSRSLVSLMLHGKYQFGADAGPPEASPALIQAVAERHLAVERERQDKERERLAQRFLQSSHNQPLAAALDQVGRELLQAPALLTVIEEG